MSAHRNLLVSVFAVPLAVLVAGCGSGSARALPPRQPAVPAVPAAGLLTAATTSAGGAPAGISVTGTAEVVGVPDTMTVSFTITITAGRAADALADDNRRTAALIARVKADGVADDDVATTGLNVGPQWSQQGIITGYQVNDSITVKVRHLDTAGTVIDHAVAEGGDALRVGGVNLTIDDTSPLLASARAAAVRDAHDRAAVLAAAAGVHLGAVRAIADQQTPTYPVSYAEPGAAVSASAAAPVPVQPGTRTLPVQVTVVYDLAG